MQSDTRIFNPDAANQPKSLVPDFKSTNEKSMSQKNIPPVDSKDSSKTPKRPNEEESIGNLKKKVSVIVFLTWTSYCFALTGVSMIYLILSTPFKSVWVRINDRNLRLKLHPSKCTSLKQFQ